MHYFHTPWKIRNELARYWIFPRVCLAFALAGIRQSHGWRIYGMPILQIHRRSQVQIGNHLQLRSSLISNPLSPAHPVVLSTREASSRLIIGDHFAITGGNVIASNFIQIGNRVTVGANSTIVDTDFHPLDAVLRHHQSSGGKNSKVIIEDDVFIGMECLILKGTHIGHGSVIAARSVVNGYIPDGVLAGGQPAQVIQSL